MQVDYNNDIIFEEGESFSHAALKIFNQIKLILFVIVITGDLLLLFLK